MLGSNRGSSLLDAAAQARAKTAATPEPTTAEIRRYLPNISQQGIKHKELLEKARATLGYICGAHDTRLDEVLNALEIDCLDFEEVNRYMASKEHDGFKFVPYNITVYQMAIPVHVLNKMIQIKERLPEAEFKIYNYERNRSNAGDPFLWVSVAGWGHYIEVWDEPEFEGRAQ